MDTTTDTVTRTIAVGNTPFAIAQAPTPPLALPIVTGISPTHGPEAGGTTVTVSGSHLTGATQVLFGSVPASGVTVVNDSTLTATAPAQADGTVDVTVITPAGTSATDPTDRYTYDEPAPAVTGISPASGVLAGGTSVTITGTDFLGATSVAFGSTPAAFTVVSDTQITATAPASSTVGPVDVTVTTPAGTSATGAADRYTYSYPFTGFYAPVANTPTLNQVHAGQAIPMKFSLGGNYGLDIIPTGFPTATQVNCATGAPVNTSTLTDTAGGSGLQYDPTTNTYTYVWKTQKAWAGTCQVFTLGLNDTSSHVADFQFVD
ncbi:MAG: cell shape-determining protein [Catenulispora sp.]|nr:cell shape-determining protein [Catenulispora sp.]